MAKKPTKLTTLEQTRDAIQTEYDRRLRKLTEGYQDNLARYDRLAEGSATRDDLRYLNGATGVPLKALVEANRAQRAERREAPPGAE